MSGSIAFAYPPGTGNAIAFVAYYALFLVLQLGLALRYLRKWNIWIFAGVWIFLFLEILGSIAYLELSYAPVTGRWYSLFVFAFTAAPTFWISSLHLSTSRSLQDMRVVTTPTAFFRPSSRMYTMIALVIDAISLLFTIVGGAFAGEKASDSPASAQPGFDLMTVAMAVQLISVTMLVLVQVEILTSIHRKHPDAKEAGTNIRDCVEQVPTGKYFVAFAWGQLFTAVVLFARCIIRAIMSAGGLTGPLRTLQLLDTNAIILFAAILVMTVLHPCIALRDNENMEK